MVFCNYCVVCVCNSIYVSPDTKPLFKHFKSQIYPGLTIAQWAQSDKFNPTKSAKIFVKAAT